MKPKGREGFEGKSGQSPESTAAEKSSRMRSGFMVISGIGSLNKSCFGGASRPDWKEFRSEWEVSKM